MEVSALPPVYPVILCGGVGERLWPLSRPWRPKPFLALAGPRTGFEAAVARAAPLASGGGELVVVGAAAHAELIAAQLDGRAAQVLLEPVGRNTAPAIAAAAAWIAARAPDAIAVILPADHHIPDEAAFRAAVTGTLAAAAGGAVVTLGIAPTSPATAYGYIQPAAGRGPLRAVAAFVEKPPADAAADLVAAGALWNSGTFVGSVGGLLGELRRHAPQVAAAAEAAVASIAPDGRLGPRFAEAPAIAFDRAVMEKTARGAVLAVDFAWSDLGAWDAVAAAEGRSPDQPFVRAPPGVRVSVVGAPGTIVVVEPDAVLVCGPGAAQSVREPGAGPSPRFASLAEAAEGLDRWLRTAALPLWATVGVDPATGAFREALTWAGAPDDPRRRARVQARQAFVFADAAAEGIPGPWLAVARAGLEHFVHHARRPDGLFAATLDLAGGQADPEARLYEHAFVLLALAGLHRADPGNGEAAREAAALRSRLERFHHAAGGFREVGERPFQANAHMHLFEAALAWEGVAGGDPAWAMLADEIAALALARFVDPASGVLAEFYDADWGRLTGEAGLIEPGHQFEWAWLLAQWGRRRGEARGEAAARRLFATGRGGFDRRRGVVVNALRDDLSVRDAGARLWPQTEHIKAALVLGAPAAALEAANGLMTYLDTPARGVWRERMRPDGGFLEESSPATSLYHLYLAVRELRRAC
ncbi:MAG: AGE family epimerase/isomerase [Caulobacterales bacterium]|nr:AGE family epimerase/isomerase [Caulobacterales bacterium]